MSKQEMPVPPTPEEVTEADLKRVEAATRIMQSFNALPPNRKREFVDESLTVLVNMSKKKLQKFFGKLFFKKGPPTVKELETTNQLIATFLHSIKDEYQMHYATMIYKAFRLPIPKELPQKLQQLRSLEWLHMGISKETYDRLYRTWEKMGFPEYDMLLGTLLKAHVQQEKANPSGKA